MRIILLAAAAWASASLAQTSDAPVQATAQPQIVAPAAQAPAPGCKADRDCPGALVCASGQCVAGANPAPGDVTVTPAQKKPERVNQFGLVLDAGLPDGVALGALFRPIPMLRISAAGAYNTIGFGARAGVTLVPFDFVISPSLTAEAGHYFAADATPLVRQAFGDPTFTNPILENVGYDFVNGHLGLEVGSPQHFMFFLRAGGSYVHTEIARSGQVLQDEFNDPTIEAADLQVTMVIPSVKLGIVAFF